MQVRNKDRDRNIADVPMTTELRRVLQDLGCAKLSDLELFALEYIQATTNCGRKVLHELQTITASPPSSVLPSRQVEPDRPDALVVPPDLREYKISHLPVSVRLQNVLRDLGCVRVGDLEQFTLDDVAAARDCGTKTSAELLQFLSHGRPLPPPQIAVSPRDRNRPLSAFRMSVRLMHVLTDAGCRELGDLERFTVEDLSRRRNCGQKTINELLALITNPQLQRWGRIFIPKEHKNTSLSSLPISVALVTALHGMGCKTLADLGRYSLDEIVQRTDCGKQAARELRDFLSSIRRTFSRHLVDGDPDNQIQAVLRLPAEYRGWPLSELEMSGTLRDYLAGINARFLGDIEGMHFSQVSMMLPSGSENASELMRLAASILRGELDHLPARDSNAVIFTVSHLEFWLGRSTAITRTVVLRRATGRTLAEVATQTNLSRERIRQIEKKELQGLGAHLGPHFLQCAAALRTMLMRYVTPLTSQLLDHVLQEHSFSTTHSPSVFLYLLDRMRLSLPVVLEGKRSARTSPAEKRLMEAVASVVKAQGKAMRLKDLFRRLAGTESFGELTLDDFLVLIAEQDRLSLDLSDPFAPTVWPPKPSRQETLRAILSQSDAPLPLDELVHKAKDHAGFSQVARSRRNIAAILNRCEGVYLLGPSTFGLHKHFAMPERMWGTARSDFKRLLQSKQRPVSTMEVCRGALFAWARLTNQYELVHILGDDHALVYLGRFLFAFKEWSIREREAIKDIIYRVLTDGCRPLSVREIYQSVLRTRYVRAVSILPVLRADRRVYDVGFGYFSARNETLDPARLVDNPYLLGRLIADSEPPLTLGELLGKLSIQPNTTAADGLWRSLRRMQNVRLVVSDDKKDTLIVHSRWRLERYVYSVLSRTTGPLSAYEVQWGLADRFGDTFSHLRTSDVGRVLRQSPLFAEIANGKFVLSTDLEDAGIDVAAVVSAATAILTRTREIVGCEDLLVRVEQDLANTPALTASILSSILRRDGSFEEIAPNCYRIRR